MYKFEHYLNKHPDQQLHDKTILKPDYKLRLTLPKNNKILNYLFIVIISNRNTNKWKSKK